MPLPTPELAAALEGVDPQCPVEILQHMTVLKIKHLDFDGISRQGHVVVDSRLADDVQAVFATALDAAFPIHSVIPISAPQFRNADGRWCDLMSMDENNSSCFNYRKIARTDQLSVHAFGQAIDINPRQNPYYLDELVLPRDATYDPNAPGTFTPEHPVVQEFLRLGWEWGGSWAGREDYHHFQKRLED